MIGLPELQPTERVDERDTMFARAARRPGTPAYDDYYGRRAELRQRDDAIRARPALGEPGGRYYHADITREAMRSFARIDAVAPSHAQVEQWSSRLAAAPDPTATVAALVRSLGAVAVGCCPVDAAYGYSHKGRFDGDYGELLAAPLPTAVVFLVEMHHGEMQCAPRAEVLRESARQYYRAARIAKALQAVLINAGYRATAHWDAHYELILPPLAVLAGLGELGRNNLLVADRYGSRVRIGAVTTDLQLPLDSPIDLGVQHFCVRCKKCATNCPSRALSEGDKVFERGVLKWPTAAHRCYGYWRWLGTDCGICMSVCPFSHRDTKFHNLVRLTVRHVHRSHGLALWFDDLIYGPKWQGPPTR